MTSPIETKAKKEKRGHEAYGVIRDKLREIMIPSGEPDANGQQFWRFPDGWDAVRVLEECGCQSAPISIVATARKHLGYLLRARKSGNSKRRGPYGRLRADLVELRQRVAYLEKQLLGATRAANGAEEVDPSSTIINGDSA